MTHFDYNQNNILWTPKEFKFSNMFSYGEDNLIDLIRHKVSQYEEVRTFGKSSM